MTKEELNGATGYKLRLIYGKWYLRLFNDAGENVGEYGPMPWSLTPEAIADAKRLGLVDIERELKTA